MAIENSATKNPPIAQMQFLFLMCNDVKKIEYFYKNLMGFETNGDAEAGYIGFNAGVEILFFKADYDLEIPKDFAWQPGYRAGESNRTSWSFQYNEAEFRKLYERLVKDKATLLSEKPEWRRDSYWGITVNDPMGNTLEIYSVPESKPEIFEWQ